MFDRQPSTGTRSGRSSVTQRTAKASTPATHRGHELHSALGNRRVLGMLRAKLKTGQPHDAYEQEADRVADLVMRTPMPTSARAAQDGGGVERTTAPVIQRACSACQAGAEEEETISASASTGLPGAIPDDLEARIEAVRAGGEPLSREVRNELEPRFGRDFGHVVVHTDSAAARTADDLQALAYTVGRDIVFASGQYAPSSEAGQRLLAHELTHVVQQTETPAREPSKARSNSEARTASDPAAAGPSVGRSSAGPQIQGTWRLGGIRPTEFGSTSSDGNSGAYKLGAHGIALASARAWQVAGFWQIYGGWARAQQLAATQYTFEHDGADDDFLELTTIASIAGQAKAQDLIYAQGAGAVAGIIKVRTHADPTPAGTQMFTPLSEGGRSSASKEKVADLDVTIPIDGSVSLNIPLNATSEGELAPIEDTLAPPDTQDIRGVIGEPRTVDVYLGAYSTVAADIETAVWDLDGDENYASVVSLYNMVWRVRSIPAPAFGGGGGSASPGPSGTSGDPAITAQYRCDAKCQENCNGEATRYLHGSSTQNCSVATQNAKSQAERGCYPRHCSCKDTDGFRGTGTQCENHSR